MLEEPHRTGSPGGPRNPLPSPARSLSRHGPCHAARIDCPDATRLFLACRPDPLAGGGTADQLRSLYRGIARALEAEGASPGHVVRERLYVRDAEAGSGALCELRGEEGPLPWSQYAPARILVEQPPAEEGDLCAAQLEVMIPASGSSARWWTFGRSAGRGDGPISFGTSAGKGLFLEGTTRIWIGDVRGSAVPPSRGLPVPPSRGGPVRDFFSEALGMFEEADALLAAQGLSFRQVVRTWIYLSAMERDYRELNRARRAFFLDRGVERRPASTGIGGAVPGGTHRAALCLEAVALPEPTAVETMHTPTLNEAHEYGSDFSRGMRVVEAGRRTLHISGTASVDEIGRSVAAGDFDGQVERMLRNVEGLLEAEGASFADLVSAVTYLKDAATAGRYRSALGRRGLDRFPHTVLQAEVCRPELLCEIEAIAIVGDRGPR